MILIGSRALSQYLDLNRPLHDWDVVMTAEDYKLFEPRFKPHWVKSTDYSHIYEIGSDIIEVRGVFDLSDSMVVDLIPCVASHLSKRAVQTPVGSALLPTLQSLYDIKKATAICIPEFKHEHDLKILENKSSFLQNTTLFETRLAETKERTSKSDKKMYDFFHKYHIPEYIKHDRLHELYADLLDLNYPTYKRITVAETDISEALFDKLTHEQKVSLMVEEVLVLNLERWLIPQNVENGINYRIFEKFYRDNEAEPVYKILKHVCLTGLKGEAKYITDFSKANFFEIEKEWVAAKKKIHAKGGFPDWFVNELIDLRQKYKANPDAVGLHHKKDNK